MGSLRVQTGFDLSLRGSCEERIKRRSRPLEGVGQQVAVASGSTREWRKTRERILARDGFRCTAQVRPGERCEGTRFLEVHHVYGSESDVLLVPNEELRTVCRRHNPRGD
jgi:5-methylcytosine-specific restriction endonuclease McrA